MSDSPQLINSRSQKRRQRFRLPHRSTHKSKASVPSPSTAAAAAATAAAPVPAQAPQASEEMVCFICSKSFRGLTLMERQMHANECLNRLEGEQMPAEPVLDSCTLCQLDLSHMTASERGEHIDLCYEEQETNMDFAESSVLQAFAQSVSGPDSAASVDISARRCSCWTCGKPLDSLKLKSRVAHVADCTRLSVDQVQELFLPEGCDEVAELRVRKKWERSRALEPAQLVEQISAQMAVVDKQILSLSKVRQTLKLQLDRARSLSRALPVEHRQAIDQILQDNPPSAPAAAASSSVERTKVEAAEVAVHPPPPPLLKQSALSKKFARQSSTARKIVKTQSDTEVVVVAVDSEDDASTDTGAEQQEEHRGGTAFDDSLDELLFEADSRDGPLPEPDGRCEDPADNVDSSCMDEWLAPSQLISSAENKSRAASTEVAAIPPAPDFAKMSKEELKKQLAQYGLKHGSMKHMRSTLSEALHTAPPTPPRPCNPSQASSAASGVSQSRAGGDSEPTKIVRELREILQFIKANERLHEHILLLGDINVNELHQCMRQQELHVSKSSLVRFLDRHGVPYTSRT